MAQQQQEATTIKCNISTHQKQQQKQPTQRQIVILAIILSRVLSLAAGFYDYFASSVHGRCMALITFELPKMSGLLVAFKHCNREPQMLQLATETQKEKRLQAPPPGAIL